MMRPLVLMALLVLTAASSSPVQADTPRVLRSVSERLIEQLNPDQISPPIRKLPSMSCISFGKPGRYGPERPVRSPFSRIDPQLKRYHRRVTFRAGKRRYELRDSLIFFAPRVIKKRVKLPPSAKLEMAYRIGPCWSKPSSATLKVRLLRANKPLFEKEYLLSTVLGRSPDNPWTELAVPFPVDLQGEVDLELTFRPGPGETRIPVVWAEPMISGLGTEAGSLKNMNVLLLIIDALRGDLAGPGRRPLAKDLAPNLNRYFKQGTSFTKVFTASNQTRHSTLAFLSSQLPTLGGFFSRSWLAKRGMRNRFYKRQPPLLPRILSRHGWYVTTIGHNRFQFESNPFGIDHGFDHIVDDRRKIEDTEWLRAKGIEFLKRRQNDRWFLYLNLVAPHLPYNPPKHFIEKVRQMGIAKQLRIPVNYLAEILYVDEEAQKVFDALHKLNLERQTLVIITADHGELFEKHHYCWSKRFQQNCGMNHGLTLYNEEVHVPLAFIFPGRVKQGHVVKTLTSQLHVTPTILNLLGLPKDRAHLGEPLTKALSGQPTQDELIYLESRTGTALIDGKWKVHAHSRFDDVRARARLGTPEKRRALNLKGLPRYQLFDLEKDPTEKDNLALGNPERVRPFLDKMQRIRVKYASKLQGVQVPSGPVSVVGGITGAAVNKLKVTSTGKKHVLKGLISAPNGHISCACHSDLTSQTPCHGKGQSTCIPRGAQTIEILLETGATHPEIAFTTLPRQTPLNLTITLDDKPVSTDSLKLGPFGLRLLRPNQTLDSKQTLRMLTGRHGPKTREKDDVAVYLWRNPRTPETDRLTVGRGQKNAVQPIRIMGPDELDSKPISDNMSPELHKVLKDLGYTK